MQRSNKNKHEKHATKDPLKKVKIAFSQSLKNGDTKKALKMIEKYGANEEVMNARDEYHAHPLDVLIRYYHCKLNDDKRLVLFEKLIAAEAMDFCYDRDTEGHPISLIQKILDSNYIEALCKSNLIVMLLKSEKLDINLVTGSAKKNGVYSTPLINMIGTCHLFAIDSFLKHPKQNIAGMNTMKGTALHKAVEIMDDRIVKMLLAIEGVDVNAKNRDGKTALHLVLENPKYDINKSAATTMRLLRHPRVNPAVTDAKGNNALHYAALQGDVAAIQSILSKKVEGCDGIDTSATNNTGMTALMLAVSNNKDDATLALLGLQDKSPKTRDKDGSTMLMLAACDGKDALVQAYLNHPHIDDQDVNARDQTGISALHLAAGNGHTSTVKILLASKRIAMGADGINAITNRGSSPLMAAAQGGSVEMVKLLLDAGADPLLENIYRKKASEIALEYGRPAIAKILIEYELHATLPAASVQTAAAFFQPVYIATAQSNKKTQLTC